MKKKIVMSLTAIIAAVSLLQAPVLAAQPYTGNTSDPQNITVTKTTTEQPSGKITNTLGFEVVWEDTDVELEQTARYDLVWNPQTLKYEKVASPGLESYYMIDKVICKVTNLSPVQIIAVPEFTAKEGLEEYILVRQANKKTSSNTWESASEHPLEAVTGVSTSTPDVAGTKGETGEYQIGLEITSSVNVSDPGNALWTALENGDTLGTVTVKVSRYTSN